MRHWRRCHDNPETITGSCGAKQLRPLDAQFALAVAGNDNPAVALAAALLSREAGEGHVCLPLSRLSLSEDAHPLLSARLAEVGEPEDWTECLLASGAVSRGEQPTPLVLHGDRLYLNRMWHNERAVARFFSEVNHAIEVDEQRLTHTLAALFPPAEGVNWQKWPLRWR